MAEAQGQPLRITVHPNMPPADPWAQVPDWNAQDAAQAQPAADPWAGVPDWDKAPAPAPPPPAEPQKEIGTGQAGMLGAIDAMSLGTAPVLQGAKEASGLPQALDTIPLPIRPYVGGVRMLADYFGAHPDPSVQEAYERGRKKAEAELHAAQDQHQWAYLAGQLAGTVASPVGVTGRAASVGGRVGQTMVSGGVGTGLYDAGTALSEGKSPAEIAKAGGKGAAVGTGFGAVGGAAAEAIGSGMGRIAQVVRGGVDRDAEAARRVLEHHGADVDTRGGRPAFTPEESRAAVAAGAPSSVVDVGGESSRALLRSAANTSPQGRQVINEFVEPRFHQQAHRIGEFIRRLGGGAHAADDVEALQGLARRANRPAYARAYGAGDRPIWSPELERLMTSDAVPQAAQAAATRGRNRAVAEGFGGFNPRVTITPDGRVLVHGRGGTPTYPNIQYWDYVQRELRDAADTASRAGANEEAGAIGALRRQLNAELDHLVPEFGQARAGAAQFFGAQDALEAGRNFVMRDTNIRDAGRALAAMNGPERELFRRGFASELADRIHGINDNVQVLNSVFLNNGPARQKIYMALGPAGARSLEALLRAELIVDQARRAMGNSTTLRQAAERGLAGAGAVGAFEAFQEQDFNPVHILTGALVLAAGHHAANRIDERTARRVAEMLVSQDPAVTAAGARVVTNNPRIFEALRLATGSAARVAGHDIGPERSAAGAAAAAQSLVSKKKEEDKTHDSDAITEQLPQ